jgi:glycerol-3-phosphate dehydrogenase
VEYLIEHEWAKTSEDILWRRTKLGLFFTPTDIEKLERALSIQI